MIQRLKKLILLTTLVLCSPAIPSDASNSCFNSGNDCGSSCDSSCGFSCTQSQNLWLPNAFSVSIDREIMLQKAAWDTKGGKEEWHGTFGVSFEYWQNIAKCSQSHCKSLGAIPFWSSNNSNKMTIGDNSGNYDLDGFQMGLGPLENAMGGITENNGTIMLNPRVYQFGGAFLLYAGTHQGERGFFAKLIGPIGVIDINPKLTYSDTIESQDYPIGSLSTSTTTTAPYKNIAQSFASGENAGDFYRQMNFGIINTKHTSSAKFGDLAIAIGYNVLANENSHVGLALRFSAPTGNKAEGVYVLEPIFGRNGHVGVGGEIIAHKRFFESDKHKFYMDLWFDGTAEHLFDSNHYRNFDLLGNGYGSKYLLLAKYSDSVTGATFQNEIINAVNITNVKVESTYAVEGNFSLAADFHYKGWNFFVAYAGWGRTCEKLSFDCSCASTVNLSQYAVIGRQQPYSQTVTVPATALDLCEPTATISKSSNYQTTASGTVKDATAASNRLSPNIDYALDLCGQRAHATFTNKASVQIGYTWDDSDYLPYIAFMGAADINLKYNSAASWWIVAAQGGLAF